MTDTQRRLIIAVFINIFGMGLAIWGFANFQNWKLHNTALYLLVLVLIAFYPWLMLINGEEDD